MSIQYGEPGDMAGSYGVVDSFPKDFGYGGDEAGIDEEDGSASADTQPRILLMGLRRSGKSSIQKVSGRESGALTHYCLTLTHYCLTLTHSLLPNPHSLTTA